MAPVANSAPGDAPSPGAAALAAWGDRWLPDPLAAPVAVAFSAGADSTALLLAAHTLWPGQVLALHVHHGLQAAADDFEAMALCTGRALGIPVHVRRLDARAQPGQSPEDAARQYRYRALADMARQRGAGCVLLGQHADDQAETLMLALARGAGLPGLAGMPERFERHGVVFGRPWLGVSPASLRAWLVARGQAFVDDPSNADPRFTRNRIRAHLLPAWAQDFPAWRETLARSMRHIAQAQGLLDELAAEDLQGTGVPPAIGVLQALSRPRQANLLRHWLRRHEAVAPSEAQLDALLLQIDACRTRGHRIHLKVADGQVQRDGDRLRFDRSV